MAETVDRDEVDELDDPRTPVCYFIVAGNDHGYFNIEPLSHEITVSSVHAVVSLKKYQPFEFMDVSVI